MEKLSGLILDHYDDTQGNVLTGLFPSEDSIPEIIKQAHYLAPEERSELASDVFALELLDGPVTLRKYACVDPGNTALSVEYFLKLGHKLPEEAQKVAATNLVTACGWYDIDPPKELQKVALGLSTLGLLAAAPSTIKNTSRQVKGNLARAKFSGSTVNPETLSLKNPMLR